MFKDSRLSGNVLYELGKKLSSSGTTYEFYSIIGKKKVGVKIFKDKLEKTPITKIQELEFEKEMKICNFLRKNKIPTPKIIGIIDVYNPTIKKSVKGLAMQTIGDELDILVLFLNTSFEYSFFVHDDFEIFSKTINFSKLTSNEEIKALHTYKDAICSTLNTMITNLSISKPKLFQIIKDSDFQGIYSKKKDTFYLIDFELWDSFEEYFLK